MLPFYFFCLLKLRESDVSIQLLLEESLLCLLLLYIILLSYVLYLLRFLLSDCQSLILFRLPSLFEMLELLLCEYFFVLVFLPLFKENLLLALSRFFDFGLFTNPLSLVLLGLH